MTRRLTFSLLLLLCLAGASSAQDIQPAKSETQPVVFGIVVDCSGSQRLQLEKTINAVKQIVETMQDGDSAFIVRFVDAAKISVVQDLTGNKPDLEDAADALYIEGGQTAVIDAIDRAGQYFAASKETADAGRIMVVISDGEDRRSAAKADDTLALLKTGEIRVFAIGISDLTVSTKLLDKFTKGTGGKTFQPRTVTDVSKAVLEIANLARTSTVKK